MRGHPEVAGRVRRSERLLISVVVVGELLFGFRKGTRFQENLAQLESFMDSSYIELVTVTFTTADRFARIAAQLRKAGTPIPSNDMWIAAQAMETGANLLSFDEHFRLIEGLAWVKPAL